MYLERLVVYLNLRHIVSSFSALQESQSSFSALQESRRPATLLKKRPWHRSVIMNSSLPSSKTQAQWQGVYRWLQFTSEKKIVCKVCCWCADNSGVGSTRKFVMGSTNYQLSAIKYHNASCPHDEAVKVKEYTFAKRQVYRCILQNLHTKHQQILSF